MQVNITISLPAADETLALYDTVRALQSLHERFIQAGQITEQEYTFAPGTVANVEIVYEETDLSPEGTGEPAYDVPDAESRNGGMC